MVYRQASTACVMCGVPLERREQLGHAYWGCPQCRGRWVAIKVLGAMFVDMRWGAHPQFSSATETGERERGCVDCGEPMLKALLEGLIVDVCQDHGVWFDPLELQQALERVGTGELRPNRRPESFAPLLQKFFEGKLD